MVVLVAGVGAVHHKCSVLSLELERLWSSISPPATSLYTRYSYYSLGFKVLVYYVALN